MRLLLLVLFTSAILASQAVSAQGLAALRRGDRIQITLVGDSVVEGKIGALWPPDSLRLVATLDGHEATYRRHEMTHLDVARHQGMTGVRVGIVVGAIAGAVVFTAFGNTSATNIATGAVVGVALAVPIAGLVGSAVPSWEPVF